MLDLKYSLADEIARTYWINARTPKHRKQRSRLPKYQVHLDQQAEQVQPAPLRNGAAHSLVTIQAKSVHWYYESLLSKQRVVLATSGNGPNNGQYTYVRRVATLEFSQKPKSTVQTDMHKR